MREGELVEKGAGVIAKPVKRFADLVLCGPVLDGEPFDVARELLDAIVADADAEVLGGDVFELVSFVEHGTAEGGNDLAERAPSHRRIGTEQVMVDNHHVRGRGALPHAGDEALIELRTFSAEAGISRCRNLVPEGDVLGQILEFGAIARLGAHRPLADHRQEDVVRGRPGDHTLREVTELVEAEVVRAALHVGRGERDPKRFAQRGNVLEIDLLLERLGPRGDQHALAPQDCGHQIGEGLAGASARFSQQNAAVLEHPGDRRRHLDLPGTRLEAGHGARERTTGGKGRRHHLGVGTGWRPLSRLR
jgi:hypothetical protein